MRTVARRRLSVALVGPDGAGKSTISDALEREQFPAPVKRIYMGVNLEASSLMLPTTRLALAMKRSRGGRADMTATPMSARESAAPRSRARRSAKAVLGGVRLALWVAEEWFRQVVATLYRARGFIVVFDRHFYADYYHFDVTGEVRRRTASAAIHGFLLRHVYPRPDLVICLDAPAHVMHARKPEATVEWLELRRQQYLQLASVVPHFAVVDVDRPLDVVVKDVARTISTFCETRRT